MQGRFMMESKRVEVSSEEDQYLTYEISHQHLLTRTQVTESLIFGRLFTNSLNVTHKSSFTVNFSFFS